MLRLFAAILVIGMIGTWATASHAQKKKSYAACLADLQKKGYSSRAAATWCTQHGYNN